jgi:flagellar biosynthesis GTPase FlhF
MNDLIEYKDQIIGNQIHYDEAVAVVKQFDIMYQWKLGEICDKLEPKYGENTLARFAEDIGKNYSLLRDCRTTYRAWKEEIIKPKSFSTAREMNTLPSEKKQEIIQNNPSITRQEARQITQQVNDVDEKTRRRVFSEKQNPEMIFNKPKANLFGEDNEIRTISIVEYKNGIKGNVELEFEDMQNDFVFKSPEIRNLLDKISTMLRENNNLALSNRFTMSVQMLKSKLMTLVKSSTGEMR